MLIEYGAESAHATASWAGRLRSLGILAAAVGPEIEAGEDECLEADEQVGDAKVDVVVGQLAVALGRARLDKAKEDLGTSV